MLVPVIGLVQVGSQAMADRYTYLPLIGLFVIVRLGSGGPLSERVRQADCVGRGRGIGHRRFVHPDGEAGGALAKQHGIVRPMP